MLIQGVSLSLADGAVITERTKKWSMFEVVKIGSEEKGLLKRYSAIKKNQFKRRKIIAIINVKYDKSSKAFTKSKNTVKLFSTYFYQKWVF